MKTIYLLIAAILICMSWSDAYCQVPNKQIQSRAEGVVTFRVVDASQFNLYPTVNYEVFSDKSLILGVEDRQFISNSSDEVLNFSYRMNGAPEMNLSVNLNGKQIGESNGMGGLFSLQFTKGRLNFTFNGISTQIAGLVTQTQGSILLLIASYKY